MHFKHYFVSSINIISSSYLLQQVSTIIGHPQANSYYGKLDILIVYIYASILIYILLHFILMVCQRTNVMWTQKLQKYAELILSLMKLCWQCEVQLLQKFIKNSFTKKNPPRMSSIKQRCKVILSKTQTGIEDSYFPPYKISHWQYFLWKQWYFIRSLHDAESPTWRNSVAFSTRN